MTNVAKTALAATQVGLLAAWQWCFESGCNVDWRAKLIAEREGYLQALKEQRTLPGQNWPASQTHYLDRIEQINRILATGDGGQGALPQGRVTRIV